MLFGLFSSPEQQREIRRKKLNVQLAGLKAKDEFYTSVYNRLGTIPGTLMVVIAEIREANLHRLK